MDYDQGVPIEEPLEVIVVGQEVTLETSTHEVLPCSHDNIKTSSRQTFQEQDKNQRSGCTVERVANVQEQLNSELKAEDGTDSQKEVKEISKRLRDKMKKRIRRSDVEYRKQESVKAKARMANRRNDPNYREMERQRDKERRAMARMNSAVREREREKDRLYKQKNRQLFSKEVGEVSTRICVTNEYDGQMAIIGMDGVETENSKHYKKMRNNKDCWRTGSGGCDGIQCTEIGAVSIINSSCDSVLHRQKGSQNGVCDRSVGGIGAIEDSRRPQVMLDADSSKQFKGDTLKMTARQVSPLADSAKIIAAESSRNVTMRSSECLISIEDSSNKQNEELGPTELDHLTVQDFAELLAEHESQIKTKTHQEGYSITMYTS